MKRIPNLLSKTKLLRGYRCHKCLYLTIHHPELEAPITPETQARFDQGNEVGILARNLFPGGILIDNPPWDFTGALAKTRALIAAGETPVLYEAAFEYMGCYARVDILLFSADTKKWRIYEVKSTTKIKPEHLPDIGLQTWILAKSGLPLEQINLLHLNPECRYPNLSNLFKEHDVTEEMRANYLSVQPTLVEMFAALRNPATEKIDIGPYCLAPTECVFTNHCWQEKQIPELSIFNLPGIKDRKWDLYYDGMTHLDDPRLHDLNELQQRVVHAYKTGERFIDKQNIHLALSDWTFPLIFLDFETINPAIPRYQGCGPYHHVPFQFSVHTWEHPDAELTHQAFLHSSKHDPRPTLIPALLEACQEKGSIVAYYGRFESDRINELADYSPQHGQALYALKDRIVDPLPIIRDFVYDNAFAGSFSLKRVAPALLGDKYSYEGMPVANGGEAQRAFEKLIAMDSMDKERDTLYQAMLDYCKKDTLAMVELVKWLYEQ
jgi:hypothetical protein